MGKEWLRRNQPTADDWLPVLLDLLGLRGPQWLESTRECSQPSPLACGLGLLSASVAIAISGSIGSG